VRALDATTTINGQSAVVVKGIKRDYYIDMFGGDDVLVLNATRNRGSVRVGLGDGNDTLIANDMGQRMATTILAGAGDDTITLSNSTFRRYVFADTGAGDDQVTAFGIRVGDLGLQNPSGNDFFNNVNSTILRPAITGFTNGVRPAAPAAPGTPDTTPPTAALSTTAGSSTKTSPIPFTVTFDEDVTGFSSSGITVTNGTASAFTQQDARSYTFQVTPAGQGAVTASVAAGAATDAAGNASLASDTVSVTFDTSTPATPHFDLDPASDTGPTVGDHRTNENDVTLTGTAEAGSVVKLFSVTVPGTPGTGTPINTTTADASGVFHFNGVSLALGPNSFAVQAVDAAGNASATFAQTLTLNAVPNVAHPVSPITTTTGSAASTIDLAGVFDDAERIVRLATQFPTGQTGNIDIDLFAGKAPQTVANFLSYVNNSSASANYDGSIFHRLAPGFVLQGGGFKFDDSGTTTATAFPAITKSPPVVNEPGVSNTQGTIAMAKSGGDPNSATDEFFFNLGDNSSNLDSQNGGFTVFGQVMNGGQQTLSKITSSLSTYSGSGTPGATPFPVRPGADTTNFPANINAGDLAFITTASELTIAQKLTFSVTGNTNAGAATASVSGSTLTITPVATGTTTITVSATDLDGATTTTQITVVVS
jgi:cyclophilin family peptidyl-prolyl cis-trans isomerase